MMFDIERELFSLQKSEENEVVARMGRRPELSINDRNIVFGLLEAGTRVADVARSLKAMQVQFIDERVILFQTT